MPGLERALGAAVFFFMALVTPAAAQSNAERARALEIYRAIVGMDTSTGTQNVAMAAYLSAQFRASGYAEEDVRVLRVGETAGFWARLRGDGSGGGAMLLLAHMDVVPARRNEWERDPFTLVEENGFFFGRGSIDNKSGVALVAATMLHLKAENFRPTRDIIVWFSGDEETSGLSTRALLTDHRALVGDAEFALNSDSGGGLLSPEGTPVAYFLQTAEKSYASYTLTARNPGGHSSLPRADNAIYDLMEALARVRAYAFPIMWNDTTLASFRATGAQVGGADGAAMLRFARRPGDRRAAATLSRNPTFVGQVRTTCVPTLLEAGHADNALPQTATATVNCRIFPGVSIADVQARLQDLVGTNVSVAPRDEYFSSEASPLRADILTALTRAVHSNYPGVPLTPSMSAGATDGVFFRSAGIPTYGVSEAFLREQDDFAHGLNERNPGTSFYAGLTHWRTLITTLAGRD